MYSKNFPSRLKKAREDSGFTQREVAEETKIAQSTLAKYETGRTEPNLDNLATLASFYGVTTDWLLSMSNQISIEETKKKQQEIKIRNEELKKLDRIG